jgi:ribose 5-phosphate isomerase A
LILNTDSFKKQAAEKAVEYLENDMVIGLGTGKTFAFALKRITELINQGKLKNIIGIPSSVDTAKNAQKFGLNLATLNDYPEIDISIDGADEVDRNLNLIKGGGGALLREKILAQATKKLIIVVDESKLSPKLGKNFPVPIEVIPFAWEPEMRFLKNLGADINLRTHTDGSIYKTDQNNLILDCNFGEIDNPRALSDQLNERAGIMAHGLFLGLASEIISAGKNGIQHFYSNNNL